MSDSRKVRSSLYIPEELRKELKYYCFFKEITMSEFVEDAIREKLAKEDYKEAYENYKKERGIGKYGKKK